MGNVRPPKSFNTVKHSNRAERLKRQQTQRLLILGMLAVAALLVLTLATLSVCSCIDLISSTGSDTTETDQPPAEPGVVVYRETTEFTSRIHSGALILVNKDRVYNFPASPTKGFINLKTADDRATINGNNVYQIYSKANSLQIQPEAYDAFQKMMRDYYMQTEDGSVTVREVYRTAETQESMNSSVKAGYSDHHTGYLINLTNYDESALPANHWVYQNCHKYGFVIRYPSGKEAQTGVSGYPEAIRYVGVAHATYMKNNNLCLEEYTNLLKAHSQENPLRVSCDNQNTYLIYYVTPLNTEIVQFKVPTNYTYEISGDNNGGLIVTVNLNSPTE